jgi:hypothetical protein
LAFAEDVVRGNAQITDCIFNLPQRFEELSQEFSKLFNKPFSLNSSKSSAKKTGKKRKAIK